MSVTLDFVAGEFSRTVLAADRDPRDVIDKNRPDRTEQFAFLVAHGVRRERHRRLHGRKAKQLQEMILKHVAHNSRIFVIATAVFYPDAFGRGDLDVIDVAPVPDRLEDRVGETENHDVLHGFFAEVVIDAVDLIFVEDFMHAPIELARGLQIGAEGLFDDHPRPALAGVFFSRQTDRSELPDHGGVEIRRQSQIEDPNRRHPAAAIEAADKILQLSVAVGFIVAAGNKIEVGREIVPHGFVLQSGAGKLAHRLAHLAAKDFVGHLAARVADDGEALRQTALQRQVIKGRNQLPPGQIAGSAENGEHTTVRTLALTQPTGTIGMRINRHRALLLFYRVATELVPKRGDHFGREGIFLA